MKRILGLWVVALAAVGCVPETPVQQMVPAPEPSSLDKVGLQVYWEATGRDLGMTPGERLQAIYHLQENVYCLTSSGRLVALDANTGVYKWSVGVAPAGVRVFRPMHVSGLSMTEEIPGALEILTPKTVTMPPFDAVVINSSGQVLVIDRKTGRVVRRVNLEHGSSCAGATDGTLFYVGTAGGWFYAVSLEQALKLWTGAAGASIDAPIECFGGVVYVADTAGTLVAAKTGGRAVDVLRKKDLGGPVRVPFSVDARGCFVPCGDNSLYAFTTDLTLKLWDHPFACRGPLRQGVQVGEKTVFQRAEEDKLYAINLLDGQARWGMAEGLQVLGAIGTDVYVRATGNRLLQVDEVLGTTKATASLGGLGLFVGNAVEPVIFAGTVSGRVVCLKPLTAGRVTPQMLKQATK